MLLPQPPEYLGLEEFSIMLDLSFFFFSVLLLVLSEFCKMYFSLIYPLPKVFPGPRLPSLPTLLCVLFCVVFNPCYVPFSLFPEEKGMIS